MIKEHLKSREPKRYIKYSTVKEWIESNWPPNAKMTWYDLDEMAIGVAGEIDSFIHALIQRNVNTLIESLNQMKRNDLKEWAFNKNDIVKDKIQEIFLTK